MSPNRWIQPTSTRRTFRLQFLRADNYDPAAAARRMIAFFQHKMHYFGKDKLVQDITLEDLSEEDMETLKSGIFLKLAWKDHAGRTILLIMPILKKEHSQKSIVSVLVFWFFCCCGGPVLVVFTSSAFGCFVVPLFLLLILPRYI